MDGDGAVEAVRVVDSRTAAPPRARTRDEAGAALPACVGVATRGYPAVETRFETALCHDDGVDRDVEAGRRRARGPAAAYSTRWLKKIEGATPVACPRRGGDAAAPRLGPGFDGAAAVDRRRWPAVDAIFAVSRGIVTRVGADGEHLWQTRGAPTWAHPQEGHVFMSLNDTVVVVSGATSIALLSAADGHVLADLRLPTNWDDEALAAPPVLRGGLIVASTQFATYVLAIDRRLVGRATARFAFAALLAAVAGLVALVVLLDD
ncbi:hypothetical protein M885DRAFT_549406 [Pelagophyceae sp. CCMP2097]|nr:hypothetical protein M885DRAFT_549406 [Pelagophyceae sp. CCMP2097]